MTRKRASRARETGPKAARPMAAGAAPQAVTGVASGGLGTGANLEETEVLRLADLEAFEALERENGFEPGPSPAPASVAPVVAAPVHRVAATSTRPTGRSPSRFAGMAGVLAVVLVVLAGLAVLTTSGNGLAGVGGAPPEAASTPTAEPATDKPDADGGKGHDKGKGGKGGGGHN